MLIEISKEIADRETLGQSAISIIHLENGEKTEFLNTRIPVEEKPIYLRLYDRKQAFLV